MDCDGLLAKTGDRSENVVSGFGPVERFRRSVVVGDEGGDRILQFLDAAMDAAPDLALG
jgi:hypothetical protein